MWCSGKTFEIERKFNLIFLDLIRLKGRSHSLGFASTFFIDTIHLWNRTKSRAEALVAELNTMRQTFKNPNINIVVVDSVEKCVNNADVIVSAIFTSSPVLYRSMMRSDVHINGTYKLKNNYSNICMVEKRAMTIRKLHISFKSYFLELKISMRRLMKVFIRMQSAKFPWFLVRI